MDQNIINRIQKLLNLSKDGRGGTAAEVESAMAMAQKLATQHNLDLATLDKGEAVPEEKYEKGTVELGQRFTVTQRFVNNILQGHFNVKVILSGSRYGGRRIHLIGKTSDIKVGEYVLNYLNSEFMRLWRATAKTHDLPAKDRNSYIYGLYQGLDGKLTREKRETESNHFANLGERADAAKQNYSLVLVTDKEKLNAAVQQHFPKLGHAPASTARVRNYDAVAMGTRDGGKISVNRPLTSGSKSYLN